MWTAWMFNEPKDASIPYIRFESEAQDVFDAWRAELELEVRCGELSPAMEAHKSKYRSLFPALALLIELADRAAAGEAPQQVTELSAARALGWIKYLEGHATRLYHSAERPEMRSARVLLKKLKAGEVSHGAPVRSVYKHKWSALRDRAEVDGALEILADHGWLKVHKFESGGRPSEVILLHPELRGEER